MAQAVGRGKNRARILSAVLFVLATLDLVSSWGVVLVFAAVLTLLSGLAAGLDRRAAGFGGLAERGRLVRRFAAAVRH